MALLRLEQLSLHYGTQILLDRVDLVLQKGARIGLLGHNGAGKSTLLKLIAGSITADEGERWVRPGTRIAWLDQALPEANDQSVFDLVAGGLEGVGELLGEYHRLAQTGADLERLAQVQQLLEAREGWSLQQKVETVLAQLQLDGDVPMRELSGGWRRRVALARALVNEPDLLLLDEPTNHLDIPAIEWLEQQLKTFPGVLLFVTHDRAFLQQVANAILELDRGHLTQWEGDYQGFLRFREHQLEVERREQALFDKKLAEEEAWIRKGIKARRTRNEGRVRALKTMREERRARREQVGKADFELESATPSGKLVAELDKVSFSYQGKPVIENFSTLIRRGDRIGLVGPNGAGKTTLLKIILGQLQPDSGSVRLGTQLGIAYFDQLRHSLEPDKSLLDNICGGREFIEIKGKNRHGISYLGDFLFAPDRARTPVKALSGGEQNRAILAKLFSQPANLLVLDEPTNDLDIDTLELLEEILLAFDGTVLLVSHDRHFMDNIVTSILAFEAPGRISEHVGGYSDWIARGGRLYRPEAMTTEAVEGEDAAVDGGVKTRSSGLNSEAYKPVKGRKLSYKEQRELDGLPQRIEALEAQQLVLEQRMVAPDFYQRDHQLVTQDLQTLAEVQQALEAAFQRWSELDALVQG